jgi:hypothetical protein
METAQSAAQQALKSKGGRPADRSLEPSSHTHVHDRYSLGFDLDQLVAEYRAMRASVISLRKRKGGRLQCACGRIFPACTAVDRESIAASREMIARTDLRRSSIDLALPQIPRFAPFSQCRRARCRNPGAL